MSKIGLSVSNFLKNIISFLDNRYIIISAFFIIAAILMIPKAPVGIYNLKEGDVAPKTIRSEISILVKDKEATQKKIQDALDNVVPIFSYDSLLVDRLEGRLDKAFSLIQNRDNNYTNPVMNEFFKSIGIKPDRTIYLRIVRLNPADIQKYAELSLDSLRDRYVVSSLPELYKLSKNIIKIRYSKQGNISITIPKSSVIDIERAKVIAYNKLKNVLRNNVALRNTTWDFVSKLIAPNLSYDGIDTEKARELAKKNIAPVYFKISKGEIIVREGDIITNSKYAELNAISSTQQNQNIYMKILAKFIIFIMLFFILYRIYKRIKHKTKLKENIIVLISAFLIILQIIIYKLSFYISNVISYSSPDFSKLAIIFSTPFAFISIMSLLLIDFEISLCLTILMSITAWLIFGLNAQFFIAAYAFFGGMTGLLAVYKEKSRSNIMKSGVYIAALNIALIIVFYMLEGISFNSGIIINLSFGAAGGLITPIIVSGIFPVFEYTFNITTDMKLLEMGNLNNPLLKELAIKAPGTYHHSIVVSSLAEAAASAIGANSLVAKVGSYYHDIGKIKKPMYFVENQADGINPHDKLKPSMSALIIMNHVKYGVEIAKKYKLGSSIIDIIQEHHGTTLIKYFYNRAKETGLNPKEENFRYPGPKPQTKEAGIIMIADEVEAASKTLSNPTAKHLEEYIKKIMRDIFLDGQLDECELTLKELNFITDSFMNVLVGIFHHRIEYEQESNVDNDNK